MLVSSGVREANGNWTGAVVLKTWGQETLTRKEHMKMKIMRAASKGPDAQV